MTYNPDIHHRHSSRLRDYDYSAAGAYFVTICTQGRECLFGEVIDGAMVLNDAGRMVLGMWRALPERFPNVATDEFVVMPNHVHGIILLNDRRGEPRVRPISGFGMKQGDHKDRPYGTGDFSLGRVCQAFKSLTTVEYVRGVKDYQWPSFPGRLWQRNYFERVIRDEGELGAIREYIRNNPLKWEQDEENPANTSM
jgi:REP element-mobilizing transposase RayT